MGFRMWGFAGMMLATVVEACAQMPGAPGPNASSEHTIFFSGKVMLDDGTAPADAVLIQRVCDGRTHNEAWTDAEGRFGFKVAVGDSDTTMADAAQPAAQDSDLNKPFGRSTQYSNPITTGLRNCELQAVLSGYGSERVSLARKSTLDNTRIGTIILHPLSRVTAFTVSATTLEAPSNPRKAYEKGLPSMLKQQSE